MTGAVHRALYVIFFALCMHRMINPSVFNLHAPAPPVRKPPGPGTVTVSAPLRNDAPPPVRNDAPPRRQTARKITIEPIAEPVADCAIAPARITIDELAASLPADIIPSRDSRGIIHNDASLAAKCAYGHLHKYDLSALSAARCPTCVGRNKFATCVRQRAEALYGKPFNIKLGVPTPCRDTLIAAPTEYANRAMLVRLVCVRAPGHDYADTDGDWLVITLHETTSVARIDNAIRQADPRVVAPQPKVAAKPKPPARRSHVWPVDPAMAAELSRRNALPSSTKIAPAGALCFENCRRG